MRFTIWIAMFGVLISLGAILAKVITWITFGVLGYAFAAILLFILIRRTQ